MLLKVSNHGLSILTIQNRVCFFCRGVVVGRTLHIRRSQFPYGDAHHLLIRKKIVKIEGFVKEKIN